MLTQTPPTSHNPCAEVLAFGGEAKTFRWANDGDADSMDPHARQEVWETVRQLVADGSTVLLTTQYLEEADQLADSITVFDKGRKVADVG